MSRGDGNRGLDIEGPFMHALEVIMNLWLLNLATLIFSIPIVTAGAAMTAMQHQLYLMSKKEEGYILKGFFKDFKDNFKRSTLAWLIMLPVGVVLGIDLVLFSRGAEFNTWYKFGVFGISVLYLFIFVYLFPILARYDCSISLALKNALFMSVFGGVKTLLMVALVLAPWAILYLVENIFPLILLFGISVPAYANVALYKKTFAAFEKNQEENRKTEPDNEAEKTEQE